MPLTLDDRLAILDVVHLHGHLTDSGELDRYGELFTADVRYDVTDAGGGVLEGLDALREAAVALGSRNPVGHHVTNVVLFEAEGEVAAHSKYLGVMADGSCGSGTYEDVFRRVDDGWRIASRTVVVQRAPLGG